MLKLHDFKLQLDQKSNDWKPTTALEKAEAEVNFKLRFQGQQGTSGLGLIPLKRPAPHTREYRQLVTQSICAEEEHKQLVKVMDFAMHGAWTKWNPRCLSTSPGTTSYTPSHPSFSPLR